MSVVWLTALEKAAELRVSRDHIYRHADALGGVRVGRILRFPSGFPSPTAISPESPPEGPAASEARATPRVARAPAAQAVGSVLKPRATNGRGRRSSTEAEAA